MKRLVWLILVACGGQPSAPTHPEARPVAPEAPARQAETPPSEADCDALISHAVALAAADRPAATDDDQAHARGDLRGQYGGKCRAMSRADYLCALSAPSLASMADCQATRSSSTSNSRVAPGGITPAAPRSP